jgi:hypothetical protein
MRLTLDESTPFQDGATRRGQGYGEVEGEFESGNLAADGQATGDQGADDAGSRTGGSIRSLMTRAIA